MRNRQFKLRTLAGGLAAITIMSNLGSITANACELDAGQETAVETVDSYQQAEVYASNDEVAEADVNVAEVEDVEAEVYASNDEAAEADVNVAEVEDVEAEVYASNDEAAKADVNVAEIETAQAEVYASNGDDAKFEVNAANAVNQEEEVEYYHKDIAAPPTNVVEAPLMTDDEIYDFEMKQKYNQAVSKLEDMSADELLSLFMAIDNEKNTNKAETKVCKDIELAKDIKEFDASEYGKKYSKQLLKEAAGKLTDMAIKNLPGSGIYGGLLKGIIGGVIGDDSQSLDLKDVVAKNAEETKNLEISMKKEFEVAKKENIDVTTLESYGSRLDNFNSKATIRAKSIQDIRDDEDLNDAQKAVQIAELIGSTSEWRTGTNNGDILLAMTSAAQCFKGGSDTDMSSRDLYNAIYEFNTHNSMFSGEASHKSEGFIQKRVQGFIRNCGVVLECFKAHKEVNNLTAEQVETLDPQTRAVYDRIKADNKNIVKQIKNVASIFLGNSKAKYDEDKIGIFDTAREYYEKDKTTYIDGGKQNIALKNQLEAKTGRDYQCGDFTNIQGSQEIIKKAGLKKEDIEKIVNQAKANNMTLVEYLKYSGFDTSNLSDGIIAVETFDDRPGDFLGISDGKGTAGVKGYKIDSKKGEHVVQDLSKHTHYHLIFGQYSSDKAINSDVKIVNFAKPEGPVAETAK